MRLGIQEIQTLNVVWWIWHVCDMHILGAMGWRSMMMQIFIQWAMIAIWILESL